MPLVNIVSQAVGADVADWRLVRILQMHGTVTQQAEREP